MFIRRTVSFPAALFFFASVLAPTARAQDAGILEPVDSTATRAAVTPSAIPGFPGNTARGAFTFPLPYNTRAVRLTNHTDCSDTLPPGTGPVDCVANTYSYWASTNNHVGRSEILVFAGFRSFWHDVVGEYGGRGPSLIHYQKSTEAVSAPEPIFVDTNFHPNDRAGVLPLRYASGERWYFGRTNWSRLYAIAPGGKKFLAIDVDRQPRYGDPTPYMGGSTVYDISNDFPSDRFLWQPHSSNDETVHSATLAQSLDNGNSSAFLGCLVHRQGRFLFFPEIGEIDECAVDKSGQWLWIIETIMR